MKKTTIKDKKMFIFSALAFAAGVALLITGLYFAAESISSSGGASAPSSTYGGDFYTGTSEQIAVVAGNTECTLYALQFIGKEIAFVMIFAGIIDIIIFAKKALLQIDITEECNATEDINLITEAELKNNANTYEQLNSSTDDNDKE